MAEYTSNAGYTSTTGNNGGVFMVHTPVWCTVVRGFQAFFGFIIMILGGILIHGLVMDAVAFGLVCGLFTLIIVTYALVSEKAPNCRNLYNIWAVLSLDLFMAILWLSSMGANAALRASFVVDVNAECYDDGSTLNAGHCTISKRVAVASDAGLAEMSAIAGLSALEMLLFIATLVYNGHAFRMHHQETKTNGGGDIGQVEMKGQPEPAVNAPTAPQYSDQQQYAPQVYQQEPSQAQQQPYDPTYYDQHAQNAPQEMAGQYNQQQQSYAYPQHTPDPYQQQQQQQPYHPPAH